VVVAVVASAISAFFYLRVIVLMFFTEPSGDAPSVVVPGLGTRAAIGLAVVATILLGVYPQVALDIADASSTFLR
jgi:NADH-quinone oxidoreductase subunit N